MGSKVFRIFLGLVILGLSCWGLSKVGKDHIRSFGNGSWPTVEGTILSSKIESAREPGTNNVRRWTLRLQYSYLIDGQEYRSSLVTFDPEGGSSLKRSKVLAMQKKTFFQGAKVPVHYDPNHPEIAVLIPGSPSYLAMVLLLLCVALGLFFVRKGFSRSTGLND